jgi:hypothetical protein
MAQPWHIPRGGRTTLAWQWAGKAAVVGLIAGMLMGMFTMISAAIGGNGFWAPLRGIAGMFFGRQHLGGSWDLPAVVVGAALHMALSIMLGVGYAVLLGLSSGRLSAAVQFAAGMGFGFAVWALNTFVIGPALPGGELMTSAMPVWTWLLGHLIYGGMLGLLYAWWRRAATALTAEGGATLHLSAA